MPEYYIRTPNKNESRGPFNIPKLLSLAEAGQVEANTLYYDEDKEEWIPIALNEALSSEVFPKPTSLKLQINLDRTDESSPQTPEKKEEISIDKILKAAEADTEETRHIKRSQKSFERAVALSSMTLGLMMLLSAISFLASHLSIIQTAVNDNSLASLFNYPFLLVGIFDLIMAVLLLLSVTDIYPLIRGRSMLGLGFGMYLGWALGDPLLMLAFGLGGVGIFLATLTKKFSIMILAIAMGIFGNGALAFLAISDRFAGFYSTFQLNLIAQ